MFKRRRSKTQSVASNGSLTGGGGAEGCSVSASEGASSSPTSPQGLRSCLRHSPAAPGRSNGNGSLGTLTGGSVENGGGAGDAHSNRSSSTKGRRSKLRKRVGFRHVIVREFERVIGDNPSCSGGAPVAYVVCPLRFARVMTLRLFPSPSASHFAYSAAHLFQFFGPPTNCFTTGLVGPLARTG
jgi:hypothetical protein